MFSFGRFSWLIPNLGIFGMKLGDCFYLADVKSCWNIAHFLREQK